MKKFASFAKPRGKEVGMHAHNNQQLAFANTIEAIIHGANRVDATMAGLGRGAGMPMELLIGFLRNPRVPHPAGPTRSWKPTSGRCAARGIELRAVQHHGPAQPTPARAPIAARGDQRSKFVEFYDRLIDEE